MKIISCSRNKLLIYGGKNHLNMTSMVLLLCFSSGKTKYRWYTVCLLCNGAKCYYLQENYAKQFKDHWCDIFSLLWRYIQYSPFNTCLDIKPSKIKYVEDNEKIIHHKMLQVGNSTGRKDKRGSIQWMGYSSTTDFLFLLSCWPLKSSSINRAPAMPKRAVLISGFSHQSARVGWLVSFFVTIICVCITRVHHQLLTMMWSGAGLCLVWRNLEGILKADLRSYV